MESKLTSLEQRIDELLASVEEKSGDGEVEQPVANGSASNGDRTSNEDRTSKGN